MSNIFLLGPGCSPSTRWLYAADSFKAGDRAKALTLLRELAAEGYVEAYAEIGNILELGSYGVIRNYEEAYFWYQAAVEADDPNGHLGLGRLLASGLGVEKDVRRAIVHLKKAATNNNPVAMTLLGVLYHLGQDVPKDLEKARELYLAAMQHGYLWPMALLSDSNSRSTIIFLA